MSKIFACRRLGANGRLRSTKHTQAHVRISQCRATYLLPARCSQWILSFQISNRCDCQLHAEQDTKLFFFYIYKTTLYFWWIWKEGRLTTFACLKHVKWFVIVIGNYALPFVATFTWTIFCQYRIHFKILRE